MTTPLFDARVASAAGKDAIMSFADATAENGMTSVIRKLLRVYTVDDAKDLLPLLYLAQAEKRVAGTNHPAIPAEVTAPRLSAFKGIFKMTKWACWREFLDNMEPRNPGYETIVTLSNWLRSSASGVKKDATKAPTTEQIVARLLAPAVARKDKDKLEPVDKVRAAPASALKAARETLAHLATIEGTGPGAKFITSALKSLDSYAPFVGKREEEAEIAAAVAKAKAKVRARLGK